MKPSERQLEIDYLGTLPRGTHFCMFYQTQGDLLDILVPYFKAGLENNEYCIWVISEPLNKKDAEKAMRMALPKFDTYLKKNQIEFIPYTEMYLENNEFDPQRILNIWVDKCNDALNNGFNRLRLTGNLCWLEDKDRKNIAVYEEDINEVITSYNMSAVCTYSLEKCASFDILDVVRNHQYGLFKREGTWNIFKSLDQVKFEKKLKESEKNYKILSNELETILDLIPGMLFCKDRNGIITRVNQNFADLLRSKREDIIGKTAFDIFPKDQAEDFRKDDLEVINTGKPKLNIEKVADFPDKKRWSTTSKIPYYNDKDEIKGIIGLAIDITERKKAEQKLKESKERLKIFMESAPNIFMLYDSELNLVDINKIGVKHFPTGTKKEDIIGKNIMELSPDVKKTGRYDEYMEVIKTGKNFSIDEFIPHPKFGSFHISLNAFKVLNGLGIIARDITEHIKKDQKLKESEKKYRDLLENMMEGYYTLDLKGNFLFVNEYFCNIVGYSKEEIIGNSYRLIFDEKTSKKLFKRYNQLYKSGIPLPHTNRDEGLTNRGKQVFLEGLIDFIYDSEGNKTGFYGFIRDITERRKAEQNLKESEEILRSTLESTSEGILVVDEYGQVKHTNSKFMEMWRIPQDMIAEREDQKLLDFVLSQLANPEAFISKVNQLYNSDSESFDTLYFKDARIFERFSSPLVHAGEINGRVWSFRDVTKQKISEQKLKESEERLTTFMNSATDGFLLYDAKLNYIDVNNVTSQIIGMSREEIIGKNILEIIPNLKETGRYDKYLEVIKTGEPFSTEDGIFNRLDGSLNSDLSIRAFKVGDNLGMIVTDITEIKRVELKLREINIELLVLNKIITLGNESTSLQEFLEKSYDQVLEVVNFDRGGIYLYDPETHHNKLVLHKNTHPDFITAIEDIDMAVKPFNLIFDMNKPYYIKDFSEFMESSKDLGIYSAVIVPLRSKDEYIGSLNVGSNTYQILSQKDLEILVAIGKQMGIIIQKFESEEKLREVNNLKSEFLKRASHELKTPLISIKGFSELILTLHEDHLDPSIISNLREINTGCERLQNIIDNLLKTSKLESPELRTNKQREDLSFLINFCVLELESMADRRNQSIKLDIHDKLYVNIEKEEIHDVISNLISNAIKYTPPRGKIVIKTKLKEDFVVVSVRDNGIGFTEDQKKLIFQQFGKIERHDEGLDLRIGGTGLGLFISKKIVESHGGKIWMESEGKNRGSKFYFSLPKMIE